MELLPLVCLCLLSWSGTTSADHHERVVVEQDDDAVLNCSFNGINIETGVFDWKRDEDQKEVFLYAAGSHYNNGRPGQDEQFKGRVSHFQDELKHGNASIKIKKTKMADKGNYTCDFPNTYPSPTFHIELVVEPALKDRTGENITGAAPRPYVKILHQTNNESLLQCEADVVPDLEVHWQDSDGNKLTAEKPQVTEGGGRKYITLNTTVTKTGYFYCVATQKNLRHRISAEVYVRLHVVVEEGSDVILPCSFGANIGGDLLEWKKDGHKVLVYNGGILSGNDLKQHDDHFSLFKDELKHGNASLKIRNTKVADKGNYTCETPHLKSSQVVRVELFVGGKLKDRTGENIPDVAPKASVTILDQTENSALLQCEAHGVPDPEVHWQDSDRNILPAEEPQVSEGRGRKYITLNTTVTKTDRFSCVATQMKHSHNISTEIYVRLNGIVVVKKGRAVVLPCSPNFNTESQMFHWKKDGQKEVFVYRAGLQSDGQDVQFKGRVSHFQDELRHGNASIKITNTKVDDSGNYTCEFPNLHPSPTFKIELVVVGEDKPQIPLSAVIGWIAAGLLCILLVVFVVLYKRERKHNKDKKQPEEEPMTQPNPGKQIDPEAEALKSVKSE